MIQLTNKQIEVVDKGLNMADILLYGGSSSGKSILNAAIVVSRAMYCKESHHLACRLHATAARESLFEDTFSFVLKNIGDEDLTPHCDIKEKDMKIKLPNGSVIFIGGTEDKERLEKLLGRTFSTIFIDEASQCSYSVYDLLWTRLREKNVLKKLFLLSENPPHTGHWTYKIFFEGIHPISKLPIPIHNKLAMKMNPHDNLDNIAPGYIQSLKDRLDASSQERFIYGNFTDIVQDAIYGEEILKAKAEGRISDDIKEQDGYPLQASFDIGLDTTAIWTFQCTEDRKIYFLDYFSDFNQPFTYYLDYLKKSGYRYSQLLFPHDVKKKFYGDLNSIYSMAHKEAQKNHWSLRVLPQMPIADGISIVKSFLNHSYINKSKCAKGLECLRNYKYDYNEILNISKPAPLHDWSSHGADSFRYACVGYVKTPKKIALPTRDISKLYVDDLFEKYKGTSVTLHPFLNL